MKEKSAAAKEEDKPVDDHTSLLKSVLTKNEKSEEKKEEPQIKQVVVSWEEENLNRTPAIRVAQVAKKGKTKTDTAAAPPQRQPKKRSSVIDDPKASELHKLFYKVSSEYTAGWTRKERSQINFACTSRPTPNGRHYCFRFRRKPSRVPSRGPEERTPTLSGGLNLKSSTCPFRMRQLAHLSDLRRSRIKVRFTPAWLSVALRLRRNRTNKLLSRQNAGTASPWIPMTADGNHPKAVSGARRSTPPSPRKFLKQRLLTRSSSSTLTFPPSRTASRHTAHMVAQCLFLPLEVLAQYPHAPSRVNAKCHSPKVLLMRMCGNGREWKSNVYAMNFSASRYEYRAGTRH